MLTVIVIAAVLAFVALALSYRLARKALRLVVRLALVGVLLVLLLVGLGAWHFWPDSRDAPRRNERRATNANARR
jgi:uncharacterized membrane protein